jgi:hypothetical protein
MGADWYSCFSFFGYEIKVPEGTTYRKFVNKLFGIESILEKPFSIMGLLSEFHSRMEYASDNELQELDESAYLIIGFYPTNDFKEMATLAEKLSEYITDNPILEGLTIEKKAEFYSGIDWFSHIECEDDSDSDTDDDDDDDSDSDTDDDENDEIEGDFDNDDDDDDSDSSDEDEHKISPEPKHKND